MTDPHGGEPETPGSTIPDNIPVSDNLSDDDLDLVAGGGANVGVVDPQK